MSAESAEKLVGDVGGNDATETPSMVMSIINEIIYSPMNLALVVIIAFLVYKIIKDRIEVPSIGTQKPAEPELPKLRRDFTIQELRQFDGTQADGRVLVAVNGNVYDVTKGKRFYGPGGPYAPFAGRDASRNLAKFNVAPNDNENYDDLSDLSAMEMDSVREWEMQFKEKYELVGKLLRKGEQHTNYEDEEDEPATTDSSPKFTDAESTTSTNTTSEKFTEAESTTSTKATSADAAEGLRKRDVNNTNSTAEEVK